MSPRTGWGKARAYPRTALTAPPVVAGNTPGRFFVLKTRDLGSLDYGAGGWEHASVRMLATGKVEVVTGASAHQIDSCFFHDAKMDGRRPSFKTGLVGHGLEELYRCRFLSGTLTCHSSLPVSRAIRSANFFNYQPSCFKAFPKS